MKDGFTAQDLAKISGLSVREQVSLSSLSTFRIGGPARWVIEARTERSLQELMRVASLKGEKLEMVGIGSNVLFPDAGVPGAVLRLGGYFRRLRFSPRGVRAGGGVSLPQLAQKATKRGLLGLEPLSGCPSTVGGAVFMNAGCYGTEISSLLVRATLINRAGDKRVVSGSELNPSYRQTVLSQTREIVTGATFALCPGDAKAAMERIQQLNEKRWASLPAGVPNAGSTFKNPPGDYAGRLIEECGLKGARQGGAQVSDKHANVLVNQGGARADEIFALMVDAYLAVRERFGIRLEPELVLVGELRDRWRLVTESPH